MNGISRKAYYMWRKKFMENLPSVQEIMDFSLKPQSERDIICRAIYTNYEKATKENDTHVMMFAYVCANSELSEDMIDDLLYINSGLFDFEWNEEVREFVISIVKRGMDYNCFDDLVEVVKEEKLTEEFRKVCQRAIDKAVDRNKTRIDNAYQDYSELLKHRGHVFNKMTRYEVDVLEGKEAKGRTKEFLDDIKNIDRAIVNVTKRIETVIAKRNEFEIYLGERLDWDALQKRQNLSREYKERRKELCKNISAYAPRSI